MKLYELKMNKQLPEAGVREEVDYQGAGRRVKGWETVLDADYGSSSWM